MLALMATAEQILRKARLLRVSYKRATFVVCACNLVVMLCLIMHMTLSPFRTTSNSLPQPDFKHNERGSKEDMERREASYKLRRALIPVRLIEEVKELQAETESDIKRTKIISAVRQKRAIEVAKRLAQVKQSNTHTNHQQGLQNWRKKKLQNGKRH